MNKTKQKILQSALSLFVTYGIDSTSTAKICKEVGISSGALFVHFKTKQELIELIYTTAKKSAILLFQSVIDKKISAKKNITTISISVLKYFNTNYEDFLFIEMINNFPNISKQMKNITIEELDGINEVLHRYKSEGKIIDMPVKKIIDIWWSLLSLEISTMKKQNTQCIDNTYVEYIWKCLKQ